MNHATNDFYVALKSMCNTVLRNTAMSIMDINIMFGPGWESIQSKVCTSMGSLSYNFCYGSDGKAFDGSRVRWPHYVISLDD